MKSLSLFVYFVAILSFVVFAETTKFKVDFILVDEATYPNAELEGTVYYTFDTSSLQRTKIRYDYRLNIGGSVTTITELEDYEEGRIFKICGTTCEAYRLTRSAQQWWFKTGDVKTSETDPDGFVRYTRSAAEYGITELWLKSESAPAIPFNVKKLVFSSGRVLTFKTGTFSTDFDDSVFEANAGGVVCSVKKCSNFMDLFFVLDSSGSVGQTNWQTMVQFVQNVTRETELGPEAGAVAVVGFGGEMTRSCDCLGTVVADVVDVEELGKWLVPGQYQYMNAHYKASKNNGKKYYDCVYTIDSNGVRTYTATPSGNEGREVCEKVLKYRKGFESYNGGTFYNLQTYITVGGKQYYTELPFDRCNGNYDNCTKYNGRLVATTFMELNEGPDTESVCNTIQNTAKYNKEAGTCQALGLFKVIDMINRNKRVIQSTGEVPKRVVISLTDGDDHCASLTKQYTEVLRTRYDATVIEVGINLETFYDKELLLNISSKFGGLPSYFDVDSFDALKELLDKMINSVCQTEYKEGAGSCSKYCLGFCGCGSQCICPTCRAELNNMCHSYTCSIQDDSYGGCTDKATVCDDHVSCTTDECLPDVGCKYTNISCSTGLKTCQNSVCVEERDGICSDVINVSSKCPSLPYPCYTAICDPENPESDPVTGCRYEYSCVGSLPAMYDESGDLVSGCYKYSCDNASNLCTTEDACKLLSESDHCNNYTCDEYLGQCVITESVTCPSTNGCLLQSTCNKNNGECDKVSRSDEECLSALIEQARYNIGEGENAWFRTESEVQSYYRCGVVRCDPDERSSAEPTKNQAGNCLFTPSDSVTCTACGGAYENQPTFESCKQEAIDMHKANNNTCYTSTCTKKTDTTSECQFTTKLCNAPPCKVAFCNETTFDCQVDWVPRYKELLLQKDACHRVECQNGQPVLVDTTSECYEGDAVPKCKLFSHCDASVGCVYKDKCVRSKNCTTMTCKKETNECVEEKVVCAASNNLCYDNICMEKTDNCEVYLKPVAEICGVGDRCHTMTCDQSISACVSVQIPFPNETDLCHLYFCDNNTGSWTVTDKCDDNDICTTDVCIIFDGTCTNYKRDCHELNMTGFGTCFARSCSKARKNGCFRKVFENSYFDECGNCIRGYSAEDSGVTESEVSECKKALTFQEEAAVVTAGVLAGIILACVIGAIAVSTAGTLATKELIKRARAANDSSAYDNPLFEEDGEELENPTFVGDD